MEATVLGVDDDDTVQETLRRFLDSKGYDVHTADNGEEALEALERVAPDVMLLDIRMPGMDGLEVLQRVEEEGLEVGVIMISGQADEETARRTLEQGAADYITKPFDLDYLELSLVAKLMTLDS